VFLAVFVTNFATNFRFYVSYILVSRAAKNLTSATDVSVFNKWNIYIYISQIYPRILRAHCIDSRK